MMKQWQWGGGSVGSLSIEDLSIWEFVCICSSSMQLHCMMQFDWSQLQIDRSLHEKAVG
jgi:hypothetical protein